MLLVLIINMLNWWTTKCKKRFVALVLTLINYSNNLNIIINAHKLDYKSSSVTAEDRLITMQAPLNRKKVIMKKKPT